MGEILIQRRTKVEKGYELLADITVGTATTSVDITGLNIGKGDEVVLVSDVTTTSEGALSVCINGNTTATNYYTQELKADSTGVYAAKYNNSWFNYITGAAKGFSRLNIKLTNSGYFIAQVHSLREYGGSAIKIEAMYVTSTFTSTAITQLTIQGNIGIGSRFQLYRIN